MFIPCGAGLSARDFRNATSGLSSERRTTNCAREAMMTATSAAAAFPRSARLLRHVDFERVYKLGKRHFSASMTVFYFERQDSSQTPAGFRVGFTVGKALGGAVDRNRMKRRLREAVRLCLPGTKAGVDVVVNPKTVLLKTDFGEITQELHRAFAVIEKKCASRDGSA